MMLMTFRILIFAILLLPYSSRAQQSSRKTATPNIILIFMDDMGFGDLGSYGALNYNTPKLDKMAADGIRFTNFLAAQAVCSASRAALLTGAYPNRIGITGALFPGSKVGISGEETTIADMLKLRGYATGIFGKWHLGDSKEFLPPNHGFDEYFGIPYSNDMWPFDFDATPAKGANRKSNFPPLTLIRNFAPVDTISTLEDQGALTSKLTTAAIGFIKRNKKKPFFAYIPYPMMHIPINASPPFRGKSRQGLYGDVVQEVDYNVGLIMEALRAEKLEENTIVIFTSDNGPWLNFGDHAGSSGGFREGKGTSFEGGQRVPFIIQWKGKIPAGLVSSQLCSTIDILPTLAALTRSALPSRKIDGVDISMILRGDLTASPRREMLYYYKKNALEAVRIDHWKYVFKHPSQSYLNQAPGKDGFPGKTTEVIMEEALYDLRRDPGEQYDVKAYHPDIVKQLMVLAESARADLGDDLQNRPGANRREPGRIK